MIVAIDEPAETDWRAVEQILTPEILHAVDRDAALHRADDGHLSFRHVAGRAEWNERLKRRRLKRFKKLELSLIDVEQRIAVWTGNALCFIGRAQFEWATAVRATHLRGADAPFLTFRRASGRDAEFGERYFVADKN